MASLILSATIFLPFFSKSSADSNASSLLIDLTQDAIHFLHCHLGTLGLNSCPSQLHDILSEVLSTRGFFLGFKYCDISSLILGFRVDTSCFSEQLSLLLQPSHPIINPSVRA